MTWIVGLDVDPGAHGALGFLRGIGAGEAVRGGGEVFAVHVLEDEHLRVVLRSHHIEEVTAAARTAAEATLSRHGVRASVEIAQGLDAVEGLTVAALGHGADAIVAGRHAGVQGRGLVRLGRIVRGLLRELPIPVVVVPHDLRPEDVGAGPVLVLSDLGDDAVPAARFARRLASWSGRRLVVAHGALENPGTPGEWAARHDVGADDLRVLEGPILTGAPRLAKELGAPVLVVGSRAHSGLEGVLHSSIGTELAAGAPLPVAVVPAGSGPAA
jgi:nucleotide-binding universal stress UspA family protein